MTRPGPGFCPGDECRVFPHYIRPPPPDFLHQHDDCCLAAVFGCDLVGRKRCGRVGHLYLSIIQSFPFSFLSTTTLHTALHSRAREQCMLHPRTGNVITTGTKVDTTPAIPRVLDLSLDAVGNVEQGDGIALAGLCTGA